MSNNFTGQITNSDLVSDSESRFYSTFNQNNGYRISKRNKALLEDDHAMLEPGEGGLTVDFLMDNQADFDPKRDRASHMENNRLRDKQKEKRRINNQIAKLQKKSAALQAQLSKATKTKGKYMEHQDGEGEADDSIFATQLSQYASSIGGKFMQLLLDPNCVRDIVTIFGFIELAYRVIDQPKIVFRVVLLCLERVIPKGQFGEWAKVISVELERWKEVLGIPTDNSLLTGIIMDKYKTHMPQMPKEWSDRRQAEMDKDPSATPYSRPKSDYTTGTQLMPPSPIMEEQIDFKSKMETCKIVMTSDTLKMFKKVVSLIVALGFTTSATTVCGLQMFSAKAAEKCESMEDIFTVSITCLDYFINVGRKFMESGSWLDLVYEDSMRTVAGRMAGIIERTEQMFCDDVDLDELLRYGVETRDLLKLKVKAEGVIGQAAILRHIARTEEFMREVRTRQKGFIPKKAPIGMNINGGSSLGKSSLCHFVCMAAAKALGLESFIGSTAAINSSTDHDDSMNSSVKCILEDDINWAKQEVCSTAQGSMAMEVVNNNPKFCKMADLDSKGAVVKTCWFYCATSNSEDMFIRSMNKPEALFRRILSTAVELKPEAQNVNGELDSEFAIKSMQPGEDGVPTRIPSEIWLLSLRKYDFRTSSYKPMHFNPDTKVFSLDPFAGSLELTRVELPLYLVALRTVVQNNNIIQEKVVKFLSKPMPSCPHGDFVQLCSECNPTFNIRQTIPPPPTTRVGAPTYVLPQYPEFVDDSDADNTEVLEMEAADAHMDNQFRIDVNPKKYFTKAITNVKDYVHPGKVIHNASLAMYDATPMWIRLQLVTSTAPVWGPLLKWYFKRNARDQISVWRLRFLFARVYGVVFVMALPLLYFISGFGRTEFCISLTVIALVSYICVTIVKNAIQNCFAAEVVKVKQSQWNLFLADSIDVTYRWRYAILGAITSFILAGLVLRRSFGKSMTEQAYEAPYDATCGWVQKDRSVQAGAEVKTATVEQLVDKIALHSAVLVAAGERGSFTCRACPYKNGTWLTNVHFLEAIENLPMSIHSAGYIRQLRISRKDWHVVRGDVALLRVSAPSQPDLSKYITKDMPTGQFPAQWLLKHINGSAQVVDVRAGFVPREGWAIIPGNKEPIIRVDLGFPSEKGMCGAILLSVSPGTISIVGIHRAGFTGTPDVAIGAFNAYDVQVAYSKFSDRLMVPHIGELDLLGVPVELSDDIPEKSCVRHLYDETGEDLSDRLMVLGATKLGDKTAKLHGNTSKSPVFTPMVEVFGEPDTGPCKYNQPEWSSSQPAVLNTLKPHLFDIPAYACANEALRAYYMRAVKQGVYNGVQPFTIEEACQGIDGRPYVNGLNYKSSVGLPRNVSKMQFSYETETGKRMVTQEIVDEVKHLIDRLSVPGAAAGVFAEFKYKDEATKLVTGPDGRTRPKNARIYASYPVAFQIIMNMVFGPLGEAQNYNPKAIGGCVGYDMCSHDADAVAEQATEYSEEEVIDGDYAHFDQSSTPEVTQDTMSIDVEIAKLIDYPEWAVTVMENVIIILTFPVAVVNGVVVVIPGMTTSGHGYTIHSNNKICKFYIGYSFYQKYLREGGPKCHTMMKVNTCGKMLEVPDIFQQSSFVTQGDDHIGSVSPTYSSYLNMETMQAELAIVDISYTDASKSAVNKKFDPMFSVLGRSLDELFEQKNAEFLKRRFVRVALHIGDKYVETTACPIALRSVTKSLYWKGSFELDHVWLEQVAQGAAREMFFYGEEVYDEFTAKLNDVIDRAGMVTYLSPLPSFEALMQRYVKTLAGSNSVKDCERTKFRGRIVLYGSTRLVFAPRLRENARYLFIVDGFTESAMKCFEWDPSWDVYPRIGLHCYEGGDWAGAKILARYANTVLVVHDERLDQVYINTFPDILQEVKSSLYRIGSDKYVTPPRGR